MALTVKADETALELFRRANRKPLGTGLTFVDQVAGGGSSSKEQGVGRGDVVELYGSSGSGKTEVLINVVAQHVLPAWLGGEEQTAYFFDNDGRLSILRLEQLLREKITNNTTFQVKTKAAAALRGGTAQQVDNDIEVLLTGCLARVRVIRPSSLFELLASLEVLQFELQHRPAVVAVDGMGSFYWQDKMAQSCGGEAVSMQGAVVRALVRLALERPVVLFAAKSALFSSYGDNKNNKSHDGSSFSTSIEHREYLPQAWQRAVTHRILLQRHQKRPNGSSTNSTDRSTIASESDVRNRHSSGPAFSLFTAKVSTLKGTSGGGVCVSRGVPARVGGGVGAKKGAGGREYFFVVTDDGIHDVPAAAALGDAGGGSMG